MHQNTHDTIKLTLDLDLCQQPNEETKAAFYRARPTQASYSVDECKPVRYGHFGFNFIKINETERTIFIDITSKILGENYPQGIHAENVSAAIDTINRTGLIFISPEALETAEVTWLDPKVDCILPRPHADTIRITKAIHVPNKFKVATAGKVSKRTFQTLYFERNTVSEKPNYIFRLYKKDEEMKDKKNLNFNLSLKEKAAEVMAQLAGKTSIEGSYKSKAEIRKAYGLAKDAKTLLLPLLQSTVNPLLTRWQDILKDFEQAQPITIENTTSPDMNNLYKLFIQRLSKNPDQKPAQNLKDISAFTEIMAYTFDWESICLFVNETCQNKNTRTGKRKQYRKMLSKWQQFQNNISSTDFAVFAEISDALKDKPAVRAVAHAATDVEKADEEYFKLLATIEREPEWLPY